MPFNQMLETIHADNAKLDSVIDRLDLLKNLFPEGKHGIEMTADGFVYCKAVVAKTVYQSDDVTVMAWDIQKENNGFEFHKHDDSLEYMIITRGIVEVTIDGITDNFTKGELIQVPTGVGHSCRALVDGCSVVGVCVPPEKAYIVENLLCQTYKESS